jgi:hypothetical protein
VVFIGRVHLTGFAAWLTWLVVHPAFLGHDRRLLTKAEWLES